MKRLLKLINKPIIIITALISAVAVILARFFMTQENEDRDNKKDK